MSDNIEILKKGLRFYCRSVIEQIPYMKWADKAVDEMAMTKQDPPTERIKNLILYVRDETLKEAKQ